MPVHTKSGRIDKRRASFGQKWAKAVRDGHKKERAAEASAAKKAKREDAARQKRWAVEARKRDRERLKKEKERQKESDRQQRIREKDAKIRKKDTEKFNQYMERFKLECEKKGIKSSEEYRKKSINKALSAGVTVAQLRKYYIDGKEIEIEKDFLIQRQKAKRDYTESRLRDKIQDLVLVNSVGFYSEKAEFQKIVDKIMDDAAGGKKDEQRYLDKINEKEQKAKFFDDEDQKILNYVSDCDEKLLHLPDDHDRVVKLASQHRQKISLDDFLKKDEVRIALKNKKEYVKQVEKQFLSIIKN